MADREKVIKGLTIERECIQRNWDGKCDRKCDKCDIVQNTEYLLNVYDSALELLKEQEAVKPIVYGTQFFCVCNCRISYGDNFCWHCGRKIQWEPIENYNIRKLKPVLMKDQHENKAWFCENA